MFRWALMGRVALGTLLGLGVLGTAGFLAYQPLVRTLVAQEVSERSAKLGLEVRHGLVDARGFLDAIEIQGVRVGPLENPLAVVPLTTLVIDKNALKNREFNLRAIKEVRLNAPVVHTESDGTLKGLFTALKNALPRSNSNTASATPRKSSYLPSLSIVNGRVVDHGGAAELSGLNVSFDAGKFSGGFVLVQPDMGPCTFEGTFNRAEENVQVRCERAFDQPLPGDFVLSAGVVEFQHKPTPKVRVPAARLTAKSGELSSAHSLLGGITMDAQIELVRGLDGWPVEVDLVFPGGGRIASKGQVNEQHVSMRCSVESLDLGGVSPAFSGRFTGDLSVEGDRKQRLLELQGHGRLDQIVFEHPALSDGPIGPFDLSVNGDLTIAVPESAESYKKFTADLSRFRVTLGDVPFTGEAHLDTTGEFKRFNAAISTGIVRGDALTAAIPKGLLPNLQPLHFEGQTSFSGRVDINFERLKETVLEANLDLKRLKLIDYSPAIDFKTLRHEFTTVFEMPDETILTRQRGPETPDWVPLEEMPELLPNAVISQEDGGFYKHKGVSMLHLRGSLIRNLERGAFSRGGSTLTMQLARNLFLNRRKTLGRKLEEIILTWLLESEFTKEELITLYLNIVEFGPDIFGIREAAAHYFKRLPRDLTIEQQAFLVRLLPSPRALYEQFEKGKLKPSYKRSMERLLKLCIDKGYISEEDRSEIDEKTFFDVEDLLTQAEEKPLPVLPMLEPEDREKEETR